MTQRTKQQQRANDFDRELFGLAGRANGFGCKDQTHREADREPWWQIERELLRIRPLIRALMHDTDRQNTR